LQHMFSLWATRLQNSLHTQHRRVLAGVAITLSVLGGGAFAVANLDDGASKLPLSQVVESVNTVSLPSLWTDKSLQLFRSDVSRSSDSADSLLARLGLSDSEAAAYLRNARTARSPTAHREAETAKAHRG